MKDRPHTQMFTTTTLFVFYWTVFVHGATIKPLVKLLKVKTSSRQEISLSERVFDETISHATLGMEKILGQFGHQRVFNVLRNLENEYIRPMVLHDPDEKEVAILKMFGSISENESSRFSKTYPKIFTALVSSNFLIDLETLPIRKIQEILAKTVPKEVQEAKRVKLAGVAFGNWKENVKKFTPAGVKFR